MISKQPQGCYHYDCALLFLLLNFWEMNFHINFHHSISKEVKVRKLQPLHVADWWTMQLLNYYTCSIHLLQGKVVCRFFPQSWSWFETLLYNHQDNIKLKTCSSCYHYFSPEKKSYHGKTLRWRFLWCLWQNQVFWPVEESQFVCRGLTKHKNTKITTEVFPGTQKCEGPG